MRHNHGMSTINEALDHATNLAAYMDGLLTRFTQPGIDPTVAWTCREAHRLLRPRLDDVIGKLNAAVAEQQPVA